MWRHALMLSALLGAARGRRCPVNNYSWICDIEQGAVEQTYWLEPRVYLMDRQYQLPQGTQLRGQGPGRTMIYAVMQIQ